uniref:Chromo domain-containing protein n=1 Tax=Ananas comosus var. bracteatus TaxID=296719 RepID=A0A6V7PPA9_ANACO|nr:unnamed protein product [Ananas comosus var. bracteatus]
MSYEEFPVSIIAREVRKLRNHEIPYVKVRWNNHDDREATWELEDVMKKHHPHLFEELSPPKKQPVHCPVWAVFALRDRSPQHLGPVSQFIPQNKHSGTGLSPCGTSLSPRKSARGPVSPVRDRLPRRLPQHCSEGTGLSYQGPVPESENFQDKVKTLEIELLGRNTIYGLPPNVEKFGVHIKHSNLAICKGPVCYRFDLN